MTVLSEIAAQADAQRAAVTSCLICSTPAALPFVNAASLSATATEMRLILPGPELATETSRPRS